MNRPEASPTLKDSFRHQFVQKLKRVASGVLASLNRKFRKRHYTEKHCTKALSRPRATWHMRTHTYKSLLVVMLSIVYIQAAVRMLLVVCAVESLCLYMFCESLVAPIKRWNCRATSAAILDSDAVLLRSFGVQCDLVDKTLRSYIPLKWVLG